MNDTNNLGGTFTLPDTTINLQRIGYGAMQLAGKGVWGPPKDHDAAIAVLRTAVELGINHIDTSDFYGPHITNQIIREALHPYPNDLTIATKVGYRRPPDKSWQIARSPEDLRNAVRDNLRNLGLDSLAVVNLRLGDAKGPKDESLEEPLKALLDLQQEGLIRHLGLSRITASQFKEAVAMAKIVCVQNEYNLAHRKDDSLIDELARAGVAYTPFFPLGGFTPLQSSKLADAANGLAATPMQVALAWLLQRSPNILLIPGTSSVEHLRENVNAAKLALPSETIAELDTIGAKKS
ncbi:MAG: aldo/keto reductase family oxidoreductase [Chthoniobacterales bacterium]|nr:aldo/keto reductase family oxidoreductase [Chthoniobacterales bacterium]